MSFAEDFYIFWTKSYIFSYFLDYFWLKINIMDTNDKISELISQYSAESLPEDVKDIIPDFFMESVHISEQIESVGRFDYVSESVPEEGLNNCC